MGYQAEILADSISPLGYTLTTMQVTYPRMVHSEMMTHRMFSRNAASSRAIPLRKMIEAVTSDPVIPVYWGKNQAGMQAKEELDPLQQELAQRAWLAARDEMVYEANRMADYGVHKQVVNRLLEPFMWITVIISATDWENFFWLRCHPDAQPEIQKIAFLMRETLAASRPKLLVPATDDAHLPLIREDDRAEFSGADLARISVGRCARVSYLTHAGRRDPNEDIALCDRLHLSGHWSPFEHVATPASTDIRSGNFRGWHQYRKLYEGEYRQYYPSHLGAGRMEEVRLRNARMTP